MTATAAVNDYRAMKSAALKSWRAWAFTLADGGPPPPPLEVLEAGAVLSIPSPMAALEADAAAVRDERAIRLQADRTEAAVAERLAADGGPAGVRERLSAARAECRRLERLVGPDPRMLAVGRARTEAGKIRERHDRVFPAPSKQAKRKAGR